MMKNFMILLFLCAAHANAQDTIFQENGKPGEIVRLNSYGERTGEWKSFYESGQLWVLSNFINGQLMGPTKVYHENGKLQSLENYKNDKRTGPCKYYYGLDVFVLLV